MSHSFAQQLEIDCLECGMNFLADVYMIVDVVERPDLLEMMRNGTLHQVSCPQCGHLILLEVPFLMFHPDEVPHMVVIRAAGTGREWNKQQGLGFVRRLKESAGVGWRDEWFNGGLGSMRDQAMLAAWLSGESETAMQKLPEQQALEAARMKTEDPERYYQNLFYALVNAQDIDWKREIMENNPDLLSDEAQKVLQAQMATKVELKNPNALAVYSQNLILLAAWRGEFDR